MGISTFIIWLAYILLSSGEGFLLPFYGYNFVIIYISIAVLPLLFLYKTIFVSKTIGYRIYKITLLKNNLKIDFLTSFIRSFITYGIASVYLIIYLLLPSSLRPSNVELLLIPLACYLIFLIGFYFIKKKSFADKILNINVICDNNHKS
jgi:hypothetical protein